MKILHAGRMEVAVAMLYGYRQNIIVPNVSWGWGLRHEADLIVVNKNNYVTEVEIKISASDLRADFKKGHSHESKKIHKLVYAVPQALKDLAIEIVPKHCGIIEVYELGLGYKARHIRPAKRNKNLPLTDKDVSELMRLGMMRIWSLKHINNK